MSNLVIMTYLAKIAELANNHVIVNEMSKMAKGPSKIGENGVFDENGRNGEQRPNI